MITLAELELTSPSQLLGDRAQNNPPPTAMDKSIYLAHNVVLTKATLSHGGREVQLELWTVVGAQALVFAGPKDWLPEGTPWFCRDDQDLCDLLIYRMEEMWGSKNFNTDDPGASLNEMCSMIARISESRNPDKPLETTEPESDVYVGDLELE